MRKLKKKKYRVNIDMAWSQDYVVSAKTIGEAKKKAWERFKRMCPKKLFNLLADRED